MKGQLEKEKEMLKQKVEVLQSYIDDVKAQNIELNKRIEGIEKKEQQIKVGGEVMSGRVRCNYSLFMRF